jgi:hypothetical protein
VGAASIRKWRQNSHPTPNQDRSTTAVVIARLLLRRSDPVQFPRAVHVFAPCIAVAEQGMGMELKQRSTDLMIIPQPHTYWYVYHQLNSKFYCIIYKNKTGFFPLF